VGQRLREDAEAVSATGCRPLEAGDVRQRCGGKLGACLWGSGR